MPSSGLPSETRSAQVIVRFTLRIVLLGVFASFGNAGFSASLAVLLGMTVMIATLAAAIRREEIFSPVLTHWDEAAAYSALYCLTRLAIS
ncbi:MAG: hypothetical protein EKK40_14255 [Bradyrhizobiaceae bacterium]|nr:MAG: hypothetical protein EKK40_14255 [Bradyrhizobiaceae bacterium]